MLIKSFKNVDELIEAVNPETPEPQLVLLRELIDTNARMTERQFVQDSCTKLAGAKGRVSESEGSLAEVRNVLRGVAERWERTLHASAIRAFLYSAGAIACFVSETNLSLSIPYLMNVPPDTFSGLMMGLAMACSVLILDWVAERLGLTMSPWAALRGIQHRWLRYVASATLVAFLVAVSAMAMYTVVAMVPAREEAMKQVHNAGSDDAPLPIDMGKVSHALLWYSVCVTVGAALLTTSGTDEVRNLMRRRRLAREKAALEGQDRAAADAYASAKIDLAKMTVEWERAEEVGTDAADLLRREHLLKLERALQPRPKPQPSTMDQIREALRPTLVRRLRKEGV